MTQNIHEFRLAWRWTDPKYTVLPDSVLSQFKPLEPKSANELDLRLRSSFDGPKLKRNIFYSLKKHDAEEPCGAFLTSLGIRDDTDILLSWDCDTAMKTKWHIFITYWDDFCYPGSDDLAVTPDDDSWLLSYYHEQIFEFGKRR